MMGYVDHKAIMAQDMHWFKEEFKHYRNQPYPKEFIDETQKNQQQYCEALLKRGIEVLRVA